ncbi:MAG: ribonuclease Z [Candidatus Hadarchaeota archaeon]|nr:ribonuclease Z [Candidatus Hadarchaeota archaeon]
MKLTFLGTGGSMPTAERGLSAIALKRVGELLLFDCGEGAQRQMVRAGISPLKLDAIFITHFHGDHFLGLPGLVQTMSLMDRERKLEIYGPSGTETRVDALLRIPLYTLKFEVELRDLKTGQELRRGDYTIHTCELDHNVPGIAYALIEDRRPGRFDPEKAQELGVKLGPDFSRLQSGEEVKVSGDKAVKPEQVMGPPRPGRKIAYAGDTRPSERVVELARDADVLIHDCTLSDDLEERALESGHSTPRLAAEVAKKAGVRKLVLVHVSPRYPDTSELLEQAKKVFPNSVVAHDLMELEVMLQE